MQPLHDEQVFTAHAEPGWSAWNQFSPEVEFCQFLAELCHVMQPGIILETGTGAGKVTRYLAAYGDQGAEHLGYESDPEYRKESDQPGETPPMPHMEAADLVILDSDPPWRFYEIALWGRVGKPGSVCVVHDCGNGHADTSLHMEFRRAVEQLGITGRFLSNPRGGWLGVHP